MATSFSSRLGTAPEEGCKAPVKVVASTNITLSGEQTINTTAVVAGDRVLVNGQTDATENGIYTVSTSAWSFAKDFNDAQDVLPGMLVPDRAGIVTYQLQSFTPPFVAGATAINFTQVIGGASLPIQSDDVLHNPGGGNQVLEAYLIALQSQVDGFVIPEMFETVTEMLDGYNAAMSVYSAGGTTWQAHTVTNPMVIENYYALTPVNIRAFGALEDDTTDTSLACQAAVNYAAPRSYQVLIQGDYRWKSTVTLLHNTTLKCDGSINIVDSGIGELFDCSTSGAEVRYITFEGGDWTEDATDTTGDVTFLKGYGTSSHYVRDSRIEKLKLHKFNQFMDCEYFRSFSVNDCYVFGRNGIHFGAKCVEGNLHQCVIFGSDSGNSATRGVEVSEGVTVAGQYCEGIKISKCTIDRFGRALSLYDGLDYDISDNWISTGTNPAYHSIYIASNSNLNFFRGVNITGNKFKEGKVELVSHAAPPTQAGIYFGDNEYVDCPSTPITIGNSWFDIVVDGMTVDPAGGTGSVGILCTDNNARCRFDNIRFRGTWTRLVSINGSTSKETTINNVWPDEYMDHPFYIETPVMITNSIGGQTPSSSLNQGGQILWTEDIDTGAGAAADASVAFSHSTGFKVGALVEVCIHGIFTHTASNGRIEIDSTTAGVWESAANGAGWDSDIVELTNGTVRVDASFIFKVLTDDLTQIRLINRNGTLNASDHAHVTAKYL